MSSLDPVMGGASTSTFVIDPSTFVGTFNGTCALIPDLGLPPRPAHIRSIFFHERCVWATGAPGFAKITTQVSLFQKFPDVSQFLNGSLQLRARTNSPNYAGYKIDFGALNVPKTSKYGGGSFKAEFVLQGTDWQVGV